ncbi:hypothetical protein ACU4GG_40515 [Streptomyces nojiriensis]
MSGEHAFLVPTGVTQLTVTADGAAVTGTLPVTPVTPVTPGATDCVNVDTGGATGAGGGEPGPRVARADGTARRTCCCPTATPVRPPSPAPPATTT